MAGDVFVCGDPDGELAVQVTAGPVHVMEVPPLTFMLSVPLILPGVFGGTGVGVGPGPVVGPGPQDHRPINPMIGTRVRIEFLSCDLIANSPLTLIQVLSYLPTPRLWTGLR